MFVNLSNHPSDHWGQKQRQAAGEFGEIVDMDFPSIDPAWSTTEVTECARKYYEQCIDIIGNRKRTSAIHLTGEPVFCFMLAQMLLRDGYVCLSSTTRRIASVRDKVKKSRFEFERFRSYKLLWDEK